MVACLTLLLSTAPVAEPDFGLRIGTKWTYSIQFAEQKAEYSLTVAKAIPEKTQTVFELHTAVGDRPGYSYRALRSNGLYTVPNRTMNGAGYLGEEATPIMIKPFLKGASWKWQAPFRGQVSHDPGGDAPDPKDLAEACKAVIEVLDESVTVPAGTFKCHRILITATSKARGTRTYRDWVSLDAGLVRRSIPARGDDPAGEWELVDFKLGRT